MSSNSNQEKNLRVLEFDGSEDCWTMWNKKHLARARIKKFKEILIGEIEVPKASEDYSGESEAEKKKKDHLKTLNDDAYNDLLLSMMDQVCFGLVDNTVTEDYPNGSAKLAWDSLNNKFEPKPGIHRIKLKEELIASKLKIIIEDPAEWIISLERLKRRMNLLNMKIDDEHLILHILSNFQGNMKALLFFWSSRLRTKQMV